MSYLILDRTNRIIRLPVDLSQREKARKRRKEMIPAIPMGAQK